MSVVAELLEADRAKQHLGTHGYREIVVKLAADQDAVLLEEVEAVLAASGKSANDLAKDIGAYKSRNADRERIATHKATAGEAIAEITRKHEAALQKFKAAEAEYNRECYVLGVERQVINTESTEVQQLERDLVEYCSDPHLAARRKALPREINRAEGAAFADMRAGRDTRATELLGQLQRESTENYSACYHW